MPAPSILKRQPSRTVSVSNGSAVDPSRNVLDLTNAGSQRQDDLREAERRFNDAQMSHVKEIGALRDEYTQRLANAESKRIDAIRAVDVNAVAVASERQAAAATVLANQVAQSADALRTLVSTTAATIAEQQRQLSAQFNERLTQVERSQYEGRGKQLVADPMMTEMITELKSLRDSRSIGSGRSKGIGDVFGYIVGAIGMVAGVIGIIVAVMNR